MKNALTHGTYILNKALSFRLAFGLLLALQLTLVGCRALQVSQTGTPKQDGPVQPEPIILREGDVVRIDFPGAPSLNTVHEQIKRDGKIRLLVGEVTAAGKTLDQLQNDLLDLYKDQLVNKIITVTLESSAFPIYVTGAVMRAGRINIDRPMTVLEAVMEAGVEYSRANLKAVRVTRNQNGQVKVFRFNLEKNLLGQDSQMFYVAPSDIIYVPPKFQWF